MEENLKIVQDFFKTDMEIKKMLYDLAPNDFNFYNRTYTIKYGDELYKSLKYIRTSFDIILERLNLNELREYFKNLFISYEFKLAECSYKYSNLKKFYQACFSNMSENLINEVNRNLVGYKIEKNIIDILKSCTSINEILHVLHSYVVNNEEIYSQMPKLESKKYNKYDYDINLYGCENDLAKGIYDNMPLDSENGITDILGLQDKIFMMIRDRGHALTIEIEEENNKIFVKYFIPKICSIEKINKLKGVNKIKEKPNSREDYFKLNTNGSFQTTKDKVVKEIIEFIEGVPMDEDLTYELDKIENRRR